MAKYKVKEYHAEFEYDENDEYEFPRKKHLTYETEVTWDNTFCPTQIAVKALWDKYQDQVEEDEFLETFAAFSYGYDDYSNLHYLSADWCDGDNVEFICISIKEI
jgi:hypothetical protein